MQTQRASDATMWSYKWDLYNYQFFGVCGTWVLDGCVMDISAQDRDHAPAKKVSKEKKEKKKERTTGKMQRDIIYLPSMLAVEWYP